jgi:hypothetical protein
MENGKEMTVVGSDTIMKLVAGGDTASLSSEQKLAYYRARCEAAGIDARTAPFQFIRLQGREVLYATKGATDQLASNHGIRVEIQSHGERCADGGGAGDCEGWAPDGRHRGGPG